jgi:hypothetical protein
MKAEPTRRLKPLRSSSLTFVAILFILSIAPSAQAQHDNECSTAILRGPYGYFFSGSAAGEGRSKPHAEKQSKRTAQPSSMKSNETFREGFYLPLASCA